MLRDEPLPWLRESHAAMLRATDPSAATLAEYERDLATLERLLDARASKVQFPHLRSFSRWGAPAQGVTAALLRRTEDVARRMWSADGAGRSTLEEALLWSIGLRADPASLPFFRDAIAFTRPRDAMTMTRRRWAASAIALLELLRGDECAAATLDALLTHDDLRLRAWAADLLARVRRTEADELREDAASQLVCVAHEDRAFEPRFTARAWLQADGHAFAVDPPDGVYHFEATRGAASRTIAMRASQPLDTLAWAIVSAFGWSCERRYIFTLSDVIDDGVFRVPFEGNPLIAVTPEDGPLSTPVGALGMTPGHRFMMRYDLLAKYEFAVRLAAVKPKADPRAKYPYVAAKSGKAPPSRR